MPIDEMIEVLRRSPEERFSTSGFSWSLRELVRGLDPALPATVALREGLAGLIWSGRTADSEVYQLKSEMIHLAPALAMLCAAQSQVPSFTPDDAWFRATAIALKFGKDQTAIDDAEVLLAQVLVGDLRRGMFRASLALLNEMKVVDSWNRYFYATHDLPIDPITQEDCPWLEASLTGSDEVIDPKVALQALVRLWIERGRPNAELGTLKGLIGDRPELLVIFAADTAPLQPNPTIVKMEKEHAARLRQSEAKETSRIHELDACASTSLREVYIG